MPGAPPSPSDSEIDLLARAILARDHYRAFRPEGFDVARLLGRMLREVLAFFGDLYSHNPSLYWLLVVALGAVCALLLTHMVLTLLGAWRTPASQRTAPVVTEALDFGHEAEALAARGEHLEAAHRLLLASLRTLARREHIPLLPEDGNAAVCRKLAESKLSAPLRQQLIELITQTERAWFGAPSPGLVAPPGPELYRRWLTAHAQLARALPGRATAQAREGAP